MNFNIKNFLIYFCTSFFIFITHTWSQTLDPFNIANNSNLNINFADIEISSATSFPVTIRLNKNTVSAIAGSSVFFNNNPSCANFKIENATPNQEIEIRKIQA